MALRGETVGTAYVRILSDGAGLDEDIERQLREHDRAFQAAGDRQGEVYNKALEDRFRDSPAFRELLSGLDKAIADQDFTNDFFSSHTWQDFELEMDKRFRDVGKRAALNMRNEFIQQGKGADGLISAIENDLTPRLARATKELEAEQQKIADDFERDFHRQMATIDRDTASIFRSIDSNLDRHRGTLRRLGDDFSRTFQTVHKDFDKYKTEAEDFIRHTDDMHRRSGTALRRLATDFDKFSEPIGRLLGRGSRNNFLNFFGSVITNSLKFGNTIVSGFDKIITGFGSLSSAVVSFFSDWRKNMAEGANIFEAFVATISTGAAEGVFATLATGGLNLALAFTAAAGAFGLAAISVGALVSALLLLGGIVIALASSIEFALIAAVGALAPLLVPLGVAVAGVIAAIQEFKNASDELKPSIRTLNKEASKLWKTFKDHAMRDAPALIDKISASMDGLNKFAVAAGDGARNMAKGIIDAVTSPSFRAFLNAFDDFLPSASRKLGIIFGNVFQGLTGLIRAAIPLANDLLNWLIKVTDKFAEFANSGKGQSDTQTFLERAAQSAQSVWHFIKEAVGLVQDLLTAGQDTGDNIFDQMANGLANVRQFLRENPDALANFFRDAKSFATSLGTAIHDISKAIQDIDSPETRRVAGALVEILGKLVLVAAGVIQAFQQVANFIIGVMRTVVDAVAGAIKAALSSLQILSDGIGLLAKGIPGPIGTALRAATGSFSHFVGDAISGVDSIQKSVDNLTTDINKPKVFNIDTGSAIAKLNILEGVANHLNAVIANAGSHHVSPVAVEHGATSSPSSSTGDQGVDPHGNRVTINVTTPTTDPKAVATETVNRLVALGLT